MAQTANHYRHAEEEAAGRAVKAKRRSRTSNSYYQEVRRRALELLEMFAVPEAQRDGTPEEEIAAMATMKELLSAFSGGAKER